MVLNSLPEILALLLFAAGCYTIFDVCRLHDVQIRPWMLKGPFFWKEWIFMWAEWDAWHVIDWMCSKLTTTLEILFCKILFSPDQALYLRWTKLPHIPAWHQEQQSAGPPLWSYRPACLALEAAQRCSSYIKADWSALICPAHIGMLPISRQSQCKNRYIPSFTRRSQIHLS